MSNINARSPYIVTINETGQIETKIQIFLWNGTGAMPTDPAYTLSKKIPSSNSPATYYDISPYIREYLNHNTLQTITTSISNTPSSQWCNVAIKKFKNISGSFVQFGGTLTYFGVNGFGYYEDGYNVNSGNILHDNGNTYNYNYDLSGEYGWLTMYVTSGMSVKWTEIGTGNTHTTGLTAGRWVDIPKTYPLYTANGNLMEIVDGGGLVWSGTFLPKDECKYTPVQVDFVNKYGAWQREWFYKASNTSIEVADTRYNLMPSSYPNYSLTEGQRKSFNVNGKQTIRVNSDWVNESYSEVIKQLMLSERILVNKMPVMLNSKNTELFKSINTKMINYQLEFEYAYDTMNSVI